MLMMLSPKVIETVDIIVFSYTCCTVLLQNLHSVIKMLKELRSPVTCFPCYTLLQVKENAQNVAPELQHS
jgi:hypothetical protein